VSSVNVGRWPIEVAEDFPKANVIGMDLAPNQPTDNIPNNCDFRVGDMTRDLDLFDDGSIDLVHSRYPFRVSDLVDFYMLGFADMNGPRLLMRSFVCSSLEQVGHNAAR
jgi:hypothetical protein